MSYDRKFLPNGWSYLVCAACRRLKQEGEASCPCSVSLDAGVGA